MQNLQDTKKRAQQYWFSDGINEIGLGLIFIILGIYFYIDTLRSHVGLISTILDSGLFLLIFLGGGWIINRGMMLFKEKLTYPRTGFISYQQNRRIPKWAAGLVAGIVGALAAAILVSGNLLNWLPVLTGSILCLLLLYIGFRIKLLRFYLLALAALAFGIIVNALNLEPMPGMSAVLLLTGASLIFSGAVILLNYLHNTVIPKRTFDE